MNRSAPIPSLSELDAQWARGGWDITVETTLRGHLANCLRRHAAQRATRPVDLVADILTVVLRDDLVAAVLDT